MIQLEERLIFKTFYGTIIWFDNKNYLFGFRK
jgi:hypothetical protein